MEDGSVHVLCPWVKQENLELLNSRPRELHLSLADAEVPAGAAVGRGRHQDGEHRRLLRSDADGPADGISQPMLPTTYVRQVHVPI